MGYIGRGEVARANRPRMRTDRDPHIGEYATKTNAVSSMLANPGRAANMAGSGPVGAYWPWFFSTWSQALEIFGRFCWRQARMVKSP
jgi:hypothetical protein